MGRDRTRLTRVLGKRKGSTPVEYLTADFSQPAALARTLRRLGGDRRELHAIVHCAGAYTRSRLPRSDAKELDWLMRVNVEAPIFLTLGLRKRLAASSDVIFVNSSIVHRPAVDAACYAATKHALRSLADSLRQEINAQGTRVSSLYPGRTATPMQRDNMRAEGRAYDAGELIQPEDLGAIVLHLLTLPRTIEVTDVFMRPSRRPRI
jgi:NADP-dependent 3-hydroxy acid dehydrogenase YdfG